MRLNLNWQEYFRLTAGFQATDLDQYAVAVLSKPYSVPQQLVAGLHEAADLHDEVAVIWVLAAVLHEEAAVLQEIGAVLPKAAGLSLKAFAALQEESGVFREACVVLQMALVLL